MKLSAASAALVMETFDLPVTLKLLLLQCDGDDGALKLLAKDRNHWQPA